MKISYVKIHNYRSIQDTEFACGDYAIILGPNNHGKSNILKAIRAAMEEEDLKNDDFYKQSDDAWIELTFNNLSEDEQQGLKKYLHSDNGKISVKIKTRWAKGGAKCAAETRGYVAWPSGPKFMELLRYANEASEWPRLFTDVGIQYVGGGSKTKKFEDVISNVRTYLDSHPDEPTTLILDEWSKFQGATPKRGLPRLHFVPAVCEVADEMKLKPGALFGRIFKDILNNGGDDDAQLNTLRTKLKTAFDEMKAEQSAIGLISQKIKDEMPTGWGDVVKNMNVRIQPPDLDDLYEKCVNLMVDDGVEGKLTDKGHGLQRAMLVAMTKAWAKVKPKNAGDTLPSIVLAIEEPELYLHPHAQSAFMASIKQLATEHDIQVIACTHSPLFVELDEYQKILIVEKCPSNGTHARQVVSDIFTENAASKQIFNMAYWLNPDRSRLFFARKAILVEGHTEAAIIPCIARKLDVFDHQVSVVDCGSKFNLKTYIKLCKAFKIPYYVIHDEDPVNHTETNPDKLKGMKNTFAENAEIAAEAEVNCLTVVKSEMETVLGLPKNVSKSSSKPMKAMELISSKTALELKAQFKEICDMVAAAYAKVADVPPVQKAA